MTDSSADEVLAVVDRALPDFEFFRRGVVDYFGTRPELNSQPFPIIHSIRSRIKHRDHLRDKLSRKTTDGEITVGNVFRRITDIAGVRVLHLHQAQFPEIHRVIKDRIESGDWVFNEAPVAYSWDPETAETYRGLDIKVTIKPSYYTSVHYVVRPKPKSNISCEIQVRTLFEEVWGEIDHAINYPKPTSSFACKEQIRVLAKVVSAGTRLADAIFATHGEQLTKQRIDVDGGGVKP